MPSTLPELTNDRKGRRPPVVLVVDDEPSLRRLLSFHLAKAGHNVRLAETGEQALEQVAATLPDLVLLDLMLPGIGGLDVLKELRTLHPDLPVIVMTAHGSVENAVEAMKRGAQDFITKPFEMERLRVAVRNALSIRELSLQVRDLRHELQARYGFEEIVGATTGLAAAVRLIEKVIPTDLTVLLQGESGTGKDVFARAIHHEGPRSARPFIAINCAALAESLLESELFGHERGSFTGAIATHAGKFELADGGTLFLDEVAELSRGVQAKLLRALQERTITRVGGSEPIPVDVRVICASNRDLVGEVAAGRFREDLYYRISVYPVTLPPLRERREDIAMLAHHLLKDVRGDRAPAIHPLAMDLLEAWNWPGNVRELQNVLRRASVLAGDGPIRPEHLPSDLHGLDAAAPRALGFLPAPMSAGVPTLEEVERQHILRVIENCRGNLSRAARMLDIGRTTLYRKLERYGLAPDMSA